MKTGLLGDAPGRLLVREFAVILRYTHSDAP